MAQETQATFKGNPITLIGPTLNVGDKAPDFKLAKSLLEDVTLDSYAGKIKLLSVAPSLDTGVCDLQNKRFNEEAGKLGDNVVVLTITLDLPFAQARWCGTADATNLQTLSDYKTKSFGTAYGVLIDEFQLLMRSVFVLDADNTIRYIQYVGEMTDHPDYDAAIAAVQALL